ncbi:MAG: radical SAM protein [Theionarchaea archaeon]|nr:radical SAM protein [Theionarchaea archaeon]MBU7038657.1 radical SAM protein [Theionarchaea archaeon]
MNESTFRKSSYTVVIPLPASAGGVSYLVCNPLYGNASLMSGEELEVLSRFPTDSDVDNDAVVSQLKDEGYITTLTEEEEKELMNKRYEDQKKPQNPRTAIIVTYQCNFRCTYCWADHLFVPDTMRVVIDEKTVDAALKTMTQIPALESVEGMSFYGGEPFLPSTRSIVTYILERGSERDFSFHANTNGYYLKEFVPLFSEYAVDGLGVTLDGCQHVHDARRKRSDGGGTFFKIVEGIDDALDSGIPIGVRINVDAQNIGELLTFRDWVTEHGWVNRKNISFTCTPVLPGKDTTPPGLLTYSEMAERIVALRKESPSLFKVMHYAWEYFVEGYLSQTILQGTELQPRPFYCSAHFQTFSFDPFGDIYCCPRAVGDRTFSVGQFIPELKFNEKFEDWMNRDVLSIPRCRTCDVALMCGGGCAYEAYLQSGTLFEGYCEKYRAFLEYGAPLFVGQRM